jgi:hypothetical protein
MRGTQNSDRYVKADYGEEEKWKMMNVTQIRKK